jgi:hypothetical protein
MGHQTGPFRLEKEIVCAQRMLRSGAKRIIDIGSKHTVVPMVRAID